LNFLKDWRDDMKRTLKANDGMSLVEATIILMVLMLLTSVLAPSIYDYVVDARMVKVKEDCEAIGVSVMRLVRDVGPCLKNASTDTSCMQVMYSSGTAATDATTGTTWNITSGIGSMEEQFATNQHGTDPIYPVAAWRGAYLSAPIGGDPWGSKYAVNAKYLDPALLGAERDVDVFCISAGPNKKYETAFNGNGAGGTTRLHARGEGRRTGASRGTAASADRSDPPGSPAQRTGPTGGPVEARRGEGADAGALCPRRAAPGPRPSSAHLDRPEGRSLCVGFTE
jgi:type II secretory pathway pseudopilin PulG